MKKILIVSLINRVRFFCFIFTHMFKNELGL
jgi:hypothetical protein